MNAGVRWPLAILMLLAIPVLGGFVLVHFATNDPAAAVEPDYYARSLAWDARAALQAASDELGWTSHVSAVPSADGGLELSVALTDRAGSPIDNATGRVVAFAIARSAARSTVPLERRAAGVYAARVPGARPGLWEFRIEAREGAALFLVTQRIEVGTGAGS